MATKVNLTYTRLASIRKQFGLSQKRFADVLGINWRTYIRFEMGERNIPGPVARLTWFLFKYGIPKEWGE